MTCQRCGAGDVEVAYSHDLGQDVCLGCYDRHASRPVVGPQDPAVARLTRYVRATENRRIKVSEHAPPGALENLRRSYERAGLHPVVDDVLEVIHTDCPFCGAGDEVYSPVRVVPRRRYRQDAKPVDDLLTIFCGACNYHDELPF